MSWLSARDLAIELPIDEREELFVFFWADGSESGLIMMGKRLVESCFFNGLVIKEGGKFVGGGDDVVPMLEATGSHDTLGTDSIIVKNVGDNFYFLSKVASIGSEKVVLVEDTRFEEEVVVQEELATIAPQHDTDEGKIAMFESIAVVVVPTRKGGLGIYAIGGFVLLIVLKKATTVEAEHIFATEIVGKSLKRIGFQPIITIEEKDIVTMGYFEARIAGSAKSLVFLMNNNELKIGSIRKFSQQN